MLEKFDSYAAQISAYASTGARVLAFGTYDGAVDGKPLAHGIRPLGFLLLANPIRKTAPETLCLLCQTGRGGQSYFPGIIR